MTIPITNTINVNITTTPQGLAVPSVNSLGLFSTEIPSNIDEYRIYLNAIDVANDYGTASKTAEMANLIFSQSPNILSGDGRLVIIPLVNSIGAIQGVTSTDNITANLAGIQAVSNGDLRIVLNGNNIDLTDLDFTNASSFDDIATILQRRLVDVIVAGRVDGFNMDSKKVGLASTITFAQLPAGAGTDLSVVGLFDAAGQIAVSGNDAQGETIVDAILRTEEQVGYFGVKTNLEMEDAVIFSTATAIQARDKMFLPHFASTEDLEPITGICSIIKDATQTKTRCLFYSVNNDAANSMAAAYAGRAFSVNFNGSSTTQTMNLKALSGITPDSAINTTILNKAKVAGADVYGYISSLPVTLSHGSNDFFDNVYNAGWLKFALEVAGFNYLKQTNTKVLQTESGMNGLKDAYEKVLVQAIINELAAAGLQWNSSETFGNPDDLRRNITDVGYYIYSLPIAQQAQAERELRKAPLVQIAVKFAGAIHSSIVNVLLEK